MNIIRFRGVGRAPFGVLCVHVYTLAVCVTHGQEPPIPPPSSADLPACVLLKIRRRLLHSP